MQLSEFDYDLPEELIAQTPIEPRNASRMMILDKNTGEVLEVFASIKEASKNYPQTNKHISAVCNGKRKSCGGYG